ncbi:MAG: aminomethyl transferase family protein, partial [Proteobacteria bacterium]
KIKLVYMEVFAKNADTHGNEPIYFNDMIVGLTTSGGYGYRVNKSLAFGYVDTTLAKIGNKFLIDIQGEKIKAVVIDEPAFDSNNDRLKS